MVHRHDSEALDELLDALGNTRRRYALYCARERQKADVGEIAMTVTDWLAATTDGARSGSRQRTSVRTALHHSDLPKLAEAGLISFDRQAGTVEFDGSEFEEAVLDVLLEHERVSETAVPDDDSAYWGV